MCGGEEGGSAWGVVEDVCEAEVEVEEAWSEGGRVDMFCFGDRLEEGDGGREEAGGSKGVGGGGGREDGNVDGVDEGVVGAKVGERERARGVVGREGGRAGGGKVTGADPREGGGEGGGEGECGGVREVGGGGQAQCCSCVGQHNDARSHPRFNEIDINEIETRERGVPDGPATGG